MLSVHAACKTRILVLHESSASGASLSALTASSRARLALDAADQAVFLLLQASLRLRLCPSAVGHIL